MLSNLFVRAVAFCLLLIPCAASAQAKTPADTDHDGLSDALEQSLLQQFMPSFMIGVHDCSTAPAEFKENSRTPALEAQDGTIYGQVFPAKGSTAARPMAEIHFYHLWWRDCGPHGHPLDTEHVSALVEASGSDPSTAQWKALYWYAGAHEDTVCDVSQITRASTLHAEDRGAKVWVSPGKHASYLSEQLCTGGCGADRCEEMTSLHVSQVINLGEREHAMNGSLFIASTEWPLAGKMSVSNFPEEPLARLNALPETDIAWFHPGKHPAQQAIAISGTTAEAIGKSGESTSVALSVAGDSTSNALSTAQDSTGNALQKSYRKTKHALGTSARHVGEALRLTEKDESTQEQK